MADARKKFAGGVAVITGAGAGVGRGLALEAGRLGMTVVVADINEERANEVAAEIVARGGKAGGKAVAMVVDVSKPAELDRLAAAVAAQCGDVRLLINNAGIETIGNTWEIPVERWEAALHINIHGIVHGVRAFAPRMIASGKEGWIANLGSIGSFGIMPTQTAYILTKHAIQSFSECLYLEMEHAGANIHVSSILPGMVKSSIFDVAEGKGEPETSSRRRKIMHDMMASGGMDVEEAAKVVFAQLADGKFWVSTQPEMTRKAIDQRIRFFEEMQPPALNDETRRLL